MEGGKVLEENCFGDSQSVAEAGDRSGWLAFLRPMRGKGFEDGIADFLGILAGSLGSPLVGTLGCH
jgi:hypothetical protein